MSVTYVLDGDARSLVEALEQSVRAMAEATKESNELKKAQAAVTAEQKEAAAAAKRLKDEQRAQTEEAKKSQEQWGGLIKVIKQFGGDIAANADTVDDLSEGMEKLDGSALAVAGSVAGAAIALTGLVTVGVGAVQMLLDLGRAAVDAGEKLGDHRVDDIAAQVEALDKAWDELSITMGSGNAAVLAVTEAATGLVVELDHLVTKLDEVDGKTADWWRTLVRVGLAVTTLGGSEVARALFGFFQETGQAAGRAADFSDAYTEALENLGVQIKEGEAAFKLLVDGEKAAAKGAEDAAGAADKASKDFETFWTGVTKRSGKAFEDMEKERVKLGFEVLDDRLDQIATEAKAAEKAAQDLGRTWDKNTDEWLKKQKKAQEQLFKGLESLANSTADAAGMVLDAMVDEANAAVSAIDDQLAAAEDRLAELRDEHKRSNKDEIAETKDLIAELEASRKEAAIDAFNMQKESQIAQTVMAGALAVAQAFAQLGPIGGALATAGIGAVIATQVGIIQAQDPPAHDGGRLHDGGGADELSFGGRTVRQGEAAVVFNQRAVETGAVERAAAMNRGAPAAPQAVTIMQLADAGRVIGELVVREQNRPGSALSAAGSTGVVDPYRSR